MQNQKQDKKTIKETIGLLEQTGFYSFSGIPTKTGGSIRITIPNTLIKAGLVGEGDFCIFLVKRLKKKEEMK